MSKRDYYEVLGVQRDAATDQIRSAYRKLARKYHPDVNKAADASSKFKEATQAYEVLGDEQKRKMYDQFGHAGPGSPFQPGQAARAYHWTGTPGEGAPQGVNFEDIFGPGGQGFSGMSLEELMEALGGGARRAAGRRARAAYAEPPSGDIEHQVTLDFMQAVRGTAISVRLRRDDKTETLHVKIPPGVSEGSRVRIRGKGSSGGDLYIVTHVSEHDYFRREGDDIYVEIPIGIAEAVLGARVDVPTLEGTSTVVIPAGSPSSRKLRLRGKGVARAGGEAGDQYVVIKIVPPPEVPPKAAELVKQFEELTKFDPRAGAPWKK